MVLNLYALGFIFCLFVGDQTQTSAKPNHGQDFESCNLKFLFTDIFVIVGKIHFLLVESKNWIPRDY